MEMVWALLAQMPGWVHWQDTLVGHLVDKLESEVCLCTISQSGQNVRWYVTFILHHESIRHLYRCAMHYTKWSWHRELQCRVCPHPYLPHTRPLTFQLYPTPMEARTFKCQTRTDVVTIPSDVGPWLWKPPAERHQSAMVWQHQCCWQVCSMAYTHGL